MAGFSIRIWFRLRIFHPKELEGKKVAIRSSSVTTVAWLRGILADDYGVDLGKVHWVTFEDAHVAEYKDPPGTERAPPARRRSACCSTGEVDAAILSDPVPQDERLKSVIPDPAAAARGLAPAQGALQINHMVVRAKELGGGCATRCIGFYSESKNSRSERR